MPGEEGFGATQALWRDESVSAPPEHERTTAEAANPVADLVTYYGTEDPEKQRVPGIEDPPMDQRPGGDQDGLAR
jgi:hypothetical protein